MSDITIRPATADDAALILHLIKELAIYQQSEHCVLANEADIKRSLFSDNSNAHGLICLQGDHPIGYAVYFYTYSTWLGKRGLYLEDLYITPHARSRGAGKKVLKHLARIAVREGCGRVEWCVMHWNTPAIEFYASIGAKAQRERVGYRLEGNSLLALAEQTP